MGIAWGKSDFGLSTTPLENESGAIGSDAGAAPETEPLRNLRFSCLPALAVDFIFVHNKLGVFHAALLA